MNHDEGLTRACSWPRCAATYQADTGPAGWGWVQQPSLNVRLCPNHAVVGHSPMARFNRDHTPPLAAAVCQCGWNGEDTTPMADVRRTWVDHVATRDDEEG